MCSVGTGAGFQQRGCSCGGWDAGMGNERSLHLKKSSSEVLIQVCWLLDGLKETSGFTELTKKWLSSSLRWSSGAVLGVADLAAACVLLALP